MHLIKQYIINSLHNLDFVGDLYKEDGYYYFTVNAIEGKIADFDNTTYHLVSIDYSHLGCYIKLKLTCDFVDFAIRDQLTANNQQLTPNTYKP